MSIEAWIALSWACFSLTGIQLRSFMRSYNPEHWFPVWADRVDGDDEGRYAFLCVMAPISAVLLLVYLFFTAPGFVGKKLRERKERKRLPPAIIDEED